MTECDVTRKNTPTSEPSGRELDYPTNDPRPIEDALWVKCPGDTVEEKYPTGEKSCLQDRSVGKLEDKDQGTMKECVEVSTESTHSHKTNKKNNLETRYKNEVPS